MNAAPYKRVVLVYGKPSINGRLSVNVWHPARDRPSERRAGRSRPPPDLGRIALMTNKQPHIQGGGLDGNTHPLI